MLSNMDKSVFMKSPKAENDSQSVNQSLCYMGLLPSQTVSFTHILFLWNTFGIDSSYQLHKNQ